MEFLYPNFLWALGALAIPIIIHLFYFRRFKKVYFTNVKFLKEVKEETAARSKLRNLLVLLMRLLAVALLVFAFAQPFIPKDTDVKAGQKVVSVFLDNSFSMRAQSGDIPLFDKAKNKALEIVTAYSVEDRFQILTHDFERRHQRLVSKENAIALIEEVNISPSVKTLQNVMERQKQALNSEAIDNKVAFVISDFQSNISQLQIEEDSTIEVNFVPLQSIKEKNISIDSAWFEAPVQMLNQANKLLIKVHNYSNEEVENIPLNIDHEGQIKPIGTLTLAANASKIDTVNLSVLRTGWHEAKLSISDYPVQFDDTYYFTFYVDELVKVLSINETGANKYLNASFKNVPYFQIDNVSGNRINYGSFPDYNIVIVNEVNQISSGLSSELKQYAAAGGNVLIFPGENANKSTYNNFLNTIPANTFQDFVKEDLQVAYLNEEEFIFKDVFLKTSNNIKLPQVTGRYQVTNYPSKGEERILGFRDGTTFMGKYSIESGNIYLCASPLNTKSNDLVRNAEIFIPMLYKMAISSGKEKPISYTIGKDEILEIENRISDVDPVFKITGKEEFIPAQINAGSKIYLDINDQIKDAGYYLLRHGDNIEGKYGFNFDRKESDLSYLSASELSKFSDKVSILDNVDTANFGQLIGERDRGVVLWRWCLILALIFLALETLLLRFWKV